MITFKEVFESLVNRKNYLNERVIEEMKLTDKLIEYMESRTGEVCQNKSIENLLSFYLKDSLEEDFL